MNMEPHFLLCSSISVVCREKYFSYYKKYALLLFPCCAVPENVVLR